MIYIEAPNETEIIKPSLFLAGGITNCPDWQSIVVSQLQNLSLTILNPRRRYFPIHNLNTATEQITWEHKYLLKASAILFWFPCETLCPITLYELGAWSMTSKPLFIGTHPQYERRQDIIIQTSLVRPEIKVVNTLNDLVMLVKTWTS
jgi:hypothetical protein